MYDSFKQYQINIREHPWFENKFYYERIESFNRVMKSGYDEKRLGILCLTPRFDNRRMWNDYCDNFNGVCISINVEKVIQTLMSTTISSWHGSQNLNYLYKVEYVDAPIKIPYIDYLSINPYELAIKEIYTKFRKFEYEDERRFIIPECINQQIVFPNDIINAVIVGVNVNDSNKKYIETVWEARGRDFTIVHQDLEPKNALYQ